MKRCMLLILPALLLGWCMSALADDVEFGKLKSKTPANWKTEKPKGPFRAHQFSVPKTDKDPKDAEVVVFSSRVVQGARPRTTSNASSTCSRPATERPK